MATKRPLKAIFTGTTPTSIGEFVNGDTVGVGQGGTGQTTATAAFTALSPLSSKGDILYHDGTRCARLASGSDGTVLMLDSGVPSWQSAGTPDAHASSHQVGGSDVITVTGSMIPAGTIVTSMLAANAVTASKIATGAVTTLKLGANAVTASKIADGAVTTLKLGAGAVTATKIATGAVTTQKLGAGAVTATKIAASAVTTVKISKGAVTTAKLAASGATGEILAGVTASAPAWKKGYIPFVNASAVSRPIAITVSA